MIIILIITVLALLVFTIWNLFTLRELKSNKKNDDEKLNDSKYFELKYKIEFLVAIFSVIVALAGLLGYNSLQNAKNEVKTELGKEVANVQAKLKNAEIDINNKDSLIKSRLNEAEQNINNKDKLVRALESKTNKVSNIISTFDDKVKNQKSNLGSLENKINAINNKNIIKQNYYIISVMKFKWNDQGDSAYSKKYFFKDLTTNLNDKLPEFDKPPLIIPITESNCSVEIWHITKSSFEIRYGMLSLDLCDSIKFSALIVAK